MELLFAKVLLAPLIVLVASLLAQRVGAQRAGIFIGLPTTSLPFTLALWLSLGTAAAVSGAAGGVTGQLTCVLFAITYSRLAPALPPLRAMVSSLVLGMATAFPTLLLDSPLVKAALAVVVAMLGLATWPATSTRPVVKEGSRRHAVLLRMVAAGLTVAGLSSLAPHVGVLVAGALAALPTILIVMGPSVHRAEGAQSAVELVRGTVATIPATGSYLTIVTTTGPSVGIPWAICLGLLAMPLVTGAVMFGSTRLARLRTLRPGIA